jgi:hypothetical protein
VKHVTTLLMPEDRHAPGGRYRRVQRSSLVIRRSWLVIRRSSLLTRRSSLVIRRSSPLVRRSSLVIRRSSLLILRAVRARVMGLTTPPGDVWRASFGPVRAQATVSQRRVRARLISNPCQHGATRSELKRPVAQSRCYTTPA